MARKPLHIDSIAARFRSGVRLLSAFNEKSPKGEKAGYPTAMLYLAPATVAGGKTMCPHSTAACREGCLFTAGRGKTTRVFNARVRRTLKYLNDRDAFFDELIGELIEMQAVADEEGLTLAIRLNGTSDIAFERETFEDGRTLFDLFPRARFYDYARWPARHRKVPPNWHLTFSLADDPIERALEHLASGRNVAAVVPLREKEQAPAWFALGERDVQVVDGEAHDLRFLDPSPALVLLKPKGRLLRGGPMVREGLIAQLIRANRKSA